MRSAMVMAALLVLVAGRGAAQCNDACPGDLDSDQQVTIDELVAAVGSALNGCTGSAEREGCLASGGTVATRSCCATAPDFPDTCGIGACGCSPSSSHEVAVCDCPDGCFDREANACIR